MLDNLQANESAAKPVPSKLQLNVMRNDIECNANIWVQSEHKDKPSSTTCMF